MRRWYTSLALVLFASCTPTYINHDRPQYAPCGSTICLMGSAESSYFQLDWTGGNSVRRLVPLHGVDAKKFRAIGDEGWATDGRHAWCGYADPAGEGSQPQSLGRSYYAFNDRVWRRCRPTFIGPPPRFEIVRPASFSPLPCGVVRIGGEFYRETKGVMQKASKPDQNWFEPLPLVDRTTFQIDRETPSKEPSYKVSCAAHDARFDYSIADGEISIVGTRGENRPSGRELPCSYAQVGDSIYWHEQRVEGADTATFEVLMTESCHAPIARDSRHVYRSTKPIKGLDAATFEFVDTVSGSDRIARDRNHVYLGSSFEVLEGADPATFRRLRQKTACRSADDNYSRDATHVFYRGIMLDADPGTFEIVEPIVSAGGLCFRPNYARDALHVWYQGHELRDADPASFVDHADGSADDRRHHYVYGDVRPPHRP